MNISTGLLPINRIEITDRIEKGAHGCLYRCKDSNYVVKVVTERGNGILESSIMLSLIHPNLNSAIATYHIDSNIFIFQELQVCDVYQYLQTRVVSKEVRINWIESIILAVDCLHSNSIIHGDIKAKNVLVTDSNEVKLTDFSFSLIYTGTPMKHKVSTFSHVPLECLEEKGWSFPLDIWSLGCTMYEIFHGRRIFEFQGTRSSNIEDKEQVAILEKKHINVIRDWANRGPIHHDLIYPLLDIEFNPFRLVNPFILESDDEQDVANMNNMILTCLHVNPDNRPLIRDLMLTFTDKNPWKKEKKRIQSSPDPELDPIANSIYKRVSPDILKESYELKKKACMIISMKFQCKKMYQSEYSQDIQRAERLICEDFHYRLLP